MRDDRRQKLIANLVAGMSKPEAARAAGYSEGFSRVNVYQLTASTEFQEELAKARAASDPASQRASETTSAPDSALGNALEAQDTGMVEIDMNDGLSYKERLFVHHFTNDAKGNASLSAKLAGYSGDANAMGVYGNRLLKRAKVKSAIRARADAIMGADEVLEGISQQARGSIADVLDDSGDFDLNVTKERGTDKLLRKLKIRKRIERHRDGSETEFIDHDVEIHDSQAALKLMGQHHNVLGTKDEPDSPVLSDDAISRIGEQLLQSMLEAAARKKAEAAQAIAEGRALPPSPPNAPPVPL